MGRISKRDTPETRPKPSDTRHPFEKGNEWNYASYLLTGATRSSYTIWLFFTTSCPQRPALGFDAVCFFTRYCCITEPRLNISVAKCKPGRWSRPASSSKNRYAQQVRWSSESSVSAVFIHFCPGPVNFSPPAVRRTGRGAAAAAAVAATAPAPAANTAKQVLAEIERVMDALVAGRAKEAQLCLIFCPQHNPTFPFQVPTHV